MMRAPCSLLVSSSGGRANIARWRTCEYPYQHRTSIRNYYNVLSLNGMLCP